MVERYISVLTPEAVDDINEALAFYDRISASLGDRFKNEVFDQIDQISSWPFARKIRYDNVRFANLKSFPYALHYFIGDEPLTNIVKVIGVYSHHIDPQKWTKRK